jgi:hypothetical protein
MCFVILTHPAEYDMAIQAHIPSAICTVHNFIRFHDADDIHDFLPNVQDQNPGEFYGELAAGPAICVEKERSEIKRDNIVQAMWESYQDLVNDRVHEINKNIYFVTWLVVHHQSMLCKGLDA